MSQQSLVANPFMLMIQPEVVLAAVEKSERLSRLNRHLCRPLDRPVLGNKAEAISIAQVDLDSDEDDIDTDAAL